MINKQPTPIDKKVILPQTEKLAKSLIPDQSKFADLKLGDIVGLYYDQSNNFTKAFFEAATGHTDMGSGNMEPAGGFFVNEKGEPWNKEMLGKNIKFKPSKNFKSKKVGFPVNTHIGVVGAIHKGVPIIYHNVHNTVHAVGLDAIGDSKIKIFWAGKKQ